MESCAQAHLQSNLRVSVQAPILRASTAGKSWEWVSGGVGVGWEYLTQRRGEAESAEGIWSWGSRMLAHLPSEAKLLRRISPDPESQKITGDWLAFMVVGGWCLPTATRRLRRATETRRLMESCAQAHLWFKE